MTAPQVRELWEMDELVEEILIRIPPEEPAVLIRASLACKPWCHLLSGNAFRSRYLTFQKTPPILGVLQSWEYYNDIEHRFIPTTNFCPRNPGRRDRFVIACRHGRVLLLCDRNEAEEKEYEGEEEEDDEDDMEAEVEEEDNDTEEKDGMKTMVVWDPVSGSRTELHDPGPDMKCTTYWVTVLCAADGCNHAACNLGPFFVALIGLVKLDEDYTSHVRASVYSSETREWTSPTSIRIGSVGRDGASILKRPSVLVGQALHFLLRRDSSASDICILKYDLGTDRLSVIDLPGLCVSSMDPVIISGDDSGLGIVHLDQDMRCFMCSVEVSVDGVGSWTQAQLSEMDLKTLVPVWDPTDSCSRKLVGCVEGTSIIIVVTDLAAFTIDLKSLRLRKLYSKPFDFSFPQDEFENLFLYTSFNNPPAVARDVAVAETKISK